MTGFLASVRDGDEARTVLAAGADIVDAKEPAAGALGAVSAARLREIRAVVAGRAAVSATIGDLVPDPELIGPAIAATAASGVDYVKVGVFGAELPAPARAVVTHWCRNGVRIVLVYFAEHWQGADFAALARLGIAGVMLDTRRKDAGSLVQQLPQATLARFVGDARAAGLLAGLAGSLRADDVAPLRELAPDYLGFRGALCGEAGRGGTVDGVAVRDIARRVHARPDAVVPPVAVHVQVGANPALGR